MREDVFSEDIANDSMERKLTRGVYVGCGVLALNFRDATLKLKRKHFISTVHL